MRLWWLYVNWRWLRVCAAEDDDEEAVKGRPLVGEKSRQKRRTISCPGHGPYGYGGAQRRQSNRRRSAKREQFASYRAGGKKQPPSLSDSFVSPVRPTTGS